eukprot:13475888-Alexandrium_andersonii.AAC.1
MPRFTQRPRLQGCNPEGARADLGFGFAGRSKDGVLRVRGPPLDSRPMNGRRRMLGKLGLQARPRRFQAS